MPGDPYTAIAAAGIQYEANDRENTAQKEALDNYEGAWEQNRQGTSADQSALEDALAGYNREYSGNYAQLAQALGSPARLAAGSSARSDLAAKIATNLKGAPAINGRAGTGTNVAGMAQTAGQAYQPVLNSQAALAGETAAQGAYDAYDKNAGATFTERNTDVGRRATATQRRAQLMGLYRDNLLQSAAHKYKYQGPSNGYHNAQLLASGLKLGGSAGAAYGSGGQSASEMYGVGGSSPYRQDNGE